MDFCTEISLSLEDVSLLALSHELHSPQMGVFTRQGWTDGWKSLKCDSLESMKEGVSSLRKRLERGGGAAKGGGEGGEDGQFYKTVYMYAFEFAKAPGQRSIPVDNAKAFWGMLLPLISGGEGGSGWKKEHEDAWFEFLDEKKVKGISKDAWGMVSLIILSIATRLV